MNEYHENSGMTAFVLKKKTIDVSKGLPTRPKQEEK